MPDERLNRRTYLKFAGGAAASAALAGCTGGGDNQNQDGTDGQTSSTDSGGDGGGNTTGDFPATITQGQMPSTLDPHNHRETTTDNVVLQAYEGLLSRNADGKIIKKLATKYERTGDKTVKFTIRDGVKFHNGDTLTAEDVAFSINRIVKSGVGGLESPQKDQLSGVTGAKAMDGAVEVTSDGVNPIIFALFASYCDIMQKSWVESHDKNYVAKNMNGTGPFKLKDYTEDVKVVFERNEDYWQEPASVSELTFNAAKESSTRVNQLVNGETDIIVNVPPQDAGRVKGNSKSRLAAVPSTRIIYNAMRYDVKPFDSPKFRQAMNYAIDLQSIIKNVLSGFADQTGQPTLKEFTGYNSNVEPYPANKKKAERLVEESGNAGATITLHTPVGRYLKDLEIAQAVAQQIDQLKNVNCSVQQRDFNALAGELTDGKIKTGPHFYLIGWGNATFDASQTIIPLLTTDGALTSYSNEKVDKLMKEAQNMPDGDKRNGKLKEVNKLLHDQAPWIFLNQQYSVYGVSQRLKWKARTDERINAYAISPK
ncbi:ABC transporter substrate-binding protein [Haladaptatus paucihalophilus]|uniref:Peptide/nickel transport system substrate-binding protein n=2 Tax=Haladaptatus paucihalophilus DX253 TaxID=797209 RepID=A0A1M6T6E1_HALPU|nr:ABC transporter substrate-binding protein [Haladaptatus paucihalophilus]SHK52547.1 peptide/nickel transport system substrate-binding protein [Haladaptatus paucihalophilus DX253]